MLLDRIPITNNKFCKIKKQTSVPNAPCRLPADSAVTSSPSVSSNSYKKTHTGLPQRKIAYILFLWSSITDPGIGWLIEPITIDLFLHIALSSRLTTYLVCTIPLIMYCYLTWNGCNFACLKANSSATLTWCKISGWNSNNFASRSTTKSSAHAACLSRSPRSSSQDILKKRQSGEIIRQTGRDSLSSIIKTTLCLQCGRFHEVEYEYSGKLIYLT